MRGCQGCVFTTQQMREQYNKTHIPLIQPLQFSTFCYRVLLSTPLQFFQWRAFQTLMSMPNTMTVTERQVLPQQGRAQDSAVLSSFWRWMPGQLGQPHLELQNVKAKPGHHKIAGTRHLFFVSMKANAALSTSRCLLPPTGLQLFVVRINIQDDDSQNCNIQNQQRKT